MKGAARERPLHQIRAINLSTYPDVAEALGIDPVPLLAEAGILRSDLQDGDARLPARSAMNLLERSAEVANCDSFGIRLLQGRSFASFGPLTLLLQHLATVREVIETAIAYRRYLSDVIFMALEARSDVSLLTVDLMPAHRMPQTTDMAVAIGFLLLAGASGGGWAPEMVHFTHEAPEDQPTFRTFFGAPAEFSSGFNGFSFPSEALAIKLPLADEAMANNARRLLRIMKVTAERSPTSDHARHSIMLLLPSGRASLESVAAGLDRTPRALQRSLEAEGYTFGSLLNETRRELAQQALEGPQPITEISEQLGYASPSSFTRWFHGEFGISPSAWRESRRSGPAAHLVLRKA
jgi:AraC-like DNA-binding protein